MERTEEERVIFLHTKRGISSDQRIKRCRETDSYMTEEEEDVAF